VAYEELLEKTASTGAKIDIVLSIIRLQMFFDDKHGVQKNIERAQKYVHLFCYWGFVFADSLKACRKRWRLGPPQPSQVLQRSPPPHNPTLQGCRPSPSRVALHIYFYRTLCLLHSRSLRCPCRHDLARPCGLQEEGCGLCGSPRDSREQADTVWWCRD
jgi:hypothetical protein